MFLIVPKSRRQQPVPETTNPGQEPAKATEPTPNHLRGPTRVQGACDECRARKIKCNEAKKRQKGPLTAAQACTLEAQQTRLFEAVKSMSATIISLEASLSAKRDSRTDDDDARGPEAQPVPVATDEYFDLNAVLDKYAPLCQVKDPVPPSKNLDQHMLVRSYTPTAPIIGADTEGGTFNLVVKTYFPTDDQPGGALSNILDCMKEGEEVEIRGPTGDIKYLGDGKFEIFDEEQQFENITLILGGSGITPGYQLIARIMATDSDKTKIKVVDANKDESSILLREDLDKFAKDHKDSFEVQHILSHPSDDWKGEKGHVDADKIKKYSYGPEKESGKKNVVFLCGPPAMIQKAAMPALRDWGYEEGKDMFGF
ncbi:hypothetical protein KCU73_g1797, partial [Aureobasidium melanogenum]